LLGLVAALVRLRLGSPVLFRQLRPGLRGKPFVIYKFRTMLDLRDGQGELLPDGERMTAFGCWLRRTSVDELPEVLNVLKGQMSLVGPRPLLMRYLDRYTPAQARRHDVLPGITGLAQISGRNAITWDQKFAHDVWYVDHCSFWLDIKILLLTCRAVLTRHGVNASEDVTMPEFWGAHAPPEKDALHAAAAEASPLSRP
jgi:sugar transferase EpsL